MNTGFPAQPDDFLYEDAELVWRRFSDEKQGEYTFGPILQAQVVEKLKDKDYWCGCHHPRSQGSPGHKHITSISEGKNERR